MSLMYVYVTYADQYCYVILGFSHLTQSGLKYSVYASLSSPLAPKPKLALESPTLLPLFHLALSPSPIRVQCIPDIG